MPTKTKEAPAAPKPRKKAEPKPKAPPTMSDVEAAFYPVFEAAKADPGNGAALAHLVNIESSIRSWHDAVNNDAVVGRREEG